jgi:hypothetical protein
MKFANRKLYFSKGVNGPETVIDPCAPNGAGATPIIGDPEKDYTHADIMNALDKIKFKLHNDATGADDADLAAMQALATMDVQVYAQQTGADISGQIFTDVNTPDASEMVVIRDLLPYIGEMGSISGAGSRFPLMKEPTDQKDSLPLDVVGIGFADTLRNALFNTLYKLERVTTSAAQMYNDKRNLSFFKPVINAINGVAGAATIGSANQQAADTTGTTRDQKIYNTIMAALEKLYSLKNNVIGRKVSQLSGSNILICSPTAALRVDPIVKGQISRDTAPQLLMPIPGTTVLQWPGAVLADKTYELPDNTAILMRKTAVAGATRAIKRALVNNTGKGSVLEGGQDESAWWMSYGTYLNSTMPSNNTGNGMIVVITLPTS